MAGADGLGGRADDAGEETRGPRALGRAGRGAAGGEERPAAARTSEYLEALTSMGGQACTPLRSAHRLIFSQTRISPAEKSASAPSASVMSKVASRFLPPVGVT